MESKNQGKLGALDVDNPMEEYLVFSCTLMYASSLWIFGGATIFGWE